MTNFDDFKLATEALSGGKNTVILDDIGMPSVMVAIPMYRYSSLGLTVWRPHPAFADLDNPTVLQRQVAYMSKYLNIIANERAYSLPFRDPANAMNFDRAVQVCRNKGNGWHLTSNQLWAAVALWCRINGTMPRGNNNEGADNLGHERGVLVGIEEEYRTLTGSGPNTWNHDWSEAGISDMNGNLSEWVSGMRLVAGEIQIIANPTRNDINLAANSNQWRAIMPNGTLVAPGTSGTVRYTQTSVNFSGVTTTPAATGDGLALLQALALVPQAGQTAESYGNAWWWAVLTDERLPIRGGDWSHGDHTGVFHLNLTQLRSTAWSPLGFRSAFVN